MAARGIGRGGGIWRSGGRRRGGSWRRQEETPVLNRRSKRCSACSASFQGVETQNLCAASTSFICSACFLFSKNQNKKEGEWWSSLPPHSRLRWSKWHKRNMRHM